MNSSSPRRWIVAAAAVVLTLLQGYGGTLQAAPLPAPATDLPKAASASTQTAVFAGDVSGAWKPSTAT